MVVSFLAALKIWHNQEIVKDALPYIIECIKGTLSALKHQKKLKSI
jgi:hypothetical protein